MLVNSTKLFNDALKGHYALGAFNFVNMEVLDAIINAAEETNSPVIIACSTSAVKYMGDKMLMAMVKARCEKSKVKICLNLDHGKTYEDCKHAVDIGFTNVMIDASSLSFEENIKLTKKVVNYAHKKNVTVEAELGTLSGIEDDVNVTNGKFTDPQKAKEFVQKTGVDSLAIAIGTSHGAYKFSGEPRLRFDILEQVETLLPNFPLVLHGASSVPSELVQEAIKYGAQLKNAKGVPNEMLKKAAKHNICKINVDTDLRIAFLIGVRKTLNTTPNEIDIRKYLGEGKKMVTEVVKQKIRLFSGK